jgi:hypothetical protein
MLANLFPLPEPRLRSHATHPGVQASREAAPMRIAFSHIPDADLEGD